MPNDKTKGDSYILFQLAGSTYAIRSEVVQLVEMVEHITPVPNALPFVEGVVFTRGQVLPGINLRVRFGLPKVPMDVRSRMLVVQVDGRSVGMIVDSAREFISIPTDVIQPPSPAVSGLSGNYLKGIATMGERLILILDVEQVVHFSGVAQAVSAGT